MRSDPNRNRSARSNDSRFTIHDSRFTIHDSRFTIHDSRFTIHDSRFTIHDSRFTLYGGPMRPTSEAPANSPPACVDELEPGAVPMSPTFGILFALSFAHLVNDTLQSLVPAIYPILKTELRLDYTHIGLITLTNQLTASLLQPFVGAFTDKHPQPFSLALGMASTLAGLVLLSLAGNLALVLIAVAFVGIGSSVFHPEASRVAHLSSGGKHGFAQSVFQVGGNTGSSLGPLLAAMIVVARGQRSIMWFSLLALLGIVVLSGIGRWYRTCLAHLHTRRAVAAHRVSRLSRTRVMVSLGILIALVFSKYFYLASMASYYTF